MSYFNSTYSGNMLTQRHYPLMNNGSKCNHSAFFNYLEIKEKTKKSGWQTSLLTGPTSLAEL